MKLTFTVLHLLFLLTSSSIFSQSNSTDTPNYVLFDFVQEKDVNLETAALKQLQEQFKTLVFNLVGPIWLEQNQLIEREEILQYERRLRTDYEAIPTRKLQDALEISEVDFFITGKISKAPTNEGNRESDKYYLLLKAIPMNTLKPTIYQQIAFDKKTDLKNPNIYINKLRAFILENFVVKNKIPFDRQDQPGDYTVLVLKIKDASSCLLSLNGITAFQNVQTYLTSLKGNYNLDFVLNYNEDIPIPKSYQEAMAIGDSSGVDMVLWGACDQDCEGSGDNICIRYASVLSTKSDGLGSQGTVRILSDHEDPTSEGRIRASFISKIGYIITRQVADKAFSQGNWEKAKEYYEQILSIVSQDNLVMDEDIYFNLGFSSYSLDMSYQAFQDCIRYYKRGLQLLETKKTWKKELLTRQLLVQLIEFYLKENLAALKSNQNYYDLQRIKDQESEKLKAFINVEFANNKTLGKGIKAYVTAIQVAIHVNQDYAQAANILKNLPVTSEDQLPNLTWLNSEFYLKYAENSTDNAVSFDEVSTRIEDQASNTNNKYLTIRQRALLAYLKHEQHGTTSNFSDALTYLELASTSYLFDDELFFKYAYLQNSRFKNLPAASLYLIAARINEQWRTKDRDIYFGLLKPMGFVTTTSVSTAPDCDDYKITYHLKKSYKNLQAIADEFRFEELRTNIIRLNRRRFGTTSSIPSGEEILISDGGEAFTIMVPDGIALDIVSTEFDDIDPKITSQSLANLNGLQSKDKICPNQILVIWKGCTTKFAQTNSFLKFDETYMHLREIPQQELGRLNGNVTNACRKNKWLVIK